MLLQLRQHYLRRSDLTTFIHAHLPTPVGRTFRQFLLHLPSVLLVRKLKGVHLQVLVDLTPGTICVTPACQCHTNRQPGSLKAKAQIQWKGRRKFVWMPQYVKFCDMTAESARKDAEAWAADPLSFGPRYAVLNESGMPASSLQFRGRQCKTARQVPLVHGSLSQALVAVRACLSELRESYGEYWGDVGLQPQLATLMSSMAECHLLIDCFHSRFIVGVFSFYVCAIVSTILCLYHCQHTPKTSCGKKG